MPSRPGGPLRRPEVRRSKPARHPAERRSCPLSALTEGPAVRRSGAIGQPPRRSRQARTQSRPLPPDQGHHFGHPRHGHAHPSAPEGGHDGVRLAILSESVPDGGMKQQVHGGNHRDGRETLPADPSRLPVVHHRRLPIRRGVGDRRRLSIAEGVLGASFDQGSRFRCRRPRSGTHRAEPARPGPRCPDVRGLRRPVAPTGPVPSPPETRERAGRSPRSDPSRSG